MVVKYMDSLFFMLLVGLFVNANLATAKQCKVNGSLNIGPSYSSSASLVVNFPSALSFSNVPYVFVWARGRSKHNGLFRAKVTRIDLFCFNVTVNRYDTFSRGWNTSLTLQWEATIACSMVTSVQDNSAENNRRRYNAAFIMKRVNFPSSVRCTRVPMVYAWVHVKGRRDNNYIAKVATVDLLGFDVIITKVSLNRGPWDSSLNIQWKTRDMPSMTMVPPSSLPGLRRGQVTFYQRYEHIPEIYAWARSPTNLIPRKRYTVNIRSSSNIGFTFTIRNLNASDFNENHSLQLYWSVHQKANSEYVTKMVGNGNYSSIVDIPPITWLTTPTITETSKNVFDIFGRDIHFSVVRQMLHEATNREFPVNQTTNAEELYQVSLRGDCVYLDFDVTMQGLKKITIHARKFISNGKTLTFKAPQICEQIIESKCIYLDKAETYLDGANGKNGIAGPLVEIHVQKVEGHVEIISAANDGNFGENGSDGPAGEVGKIGKSLWVEKMHYDMQGNAIPFWRAFKCVVAKGLVGQRGGRGVDGRKAGLAGRGGHAEKVTLNTQFVLGSLKVTQRPGKGGSPAEHGYGGRGGYGGSGGCGRGCSEESCYKTSRWRDRKNCALPFIDCSNNGRGRNGPIGESALDSFKIYPLPKKGENGIVKKSVLRKVDNLKVWFVNDTELLNLIRRRGELLVARNKTGDALEIFSFLTSVTDKTSSLYWQASLQKNALQGDLMYHERNNIYPSLSWTYLKERTSNLFTAGKTYETAYNNMKHKMDDLNLASQFTKKTVNVDLTKSKRNLIDELEDLKTEKRLYVKSLKRIDKTMMTEQQEIKHLIPEIIRTSKQETARKQRKIFIDLIGATVGLATGIVTKGPGSVYSSFATIFHEFDKTLSCPIPTIDEVRSTLQIRLNFASAYGRGNVDFSAMNVSAVPIIMRSELGKNKVKLTDEIGCLLRRKHGRKVKSLSNILNDFFRNGGLRITLINKIINLDLHIKKVSHKLEVATKWKNDINTAMHSLTHSIPMSIRRKFTEMALSLYQDHEIAIKRSLYELAKAYQFMSLRKFETFKNYDNTYGDWALTSNLGQLIGMLHFQQIKQTLDDERNRFLKALSTTAGSSSHTYTLFREFDSVTHPSLMTLFRKKGRVTVHLDLNPNNIKTTGCVSCYNARLMSIYVEINGSAQPEAVPFRIYVKVAHMGDSNFLLPLSDGNKTVINFQQKPEDVAGGHVVHFNRKQLVTSLLDPLLQNKFKPSEGSRFCHDYNKVQDFFGGQLCKSPYATYTITVPRRRRLPCHRHVSGTNCQDLDFTRFEKLRMFLKIKAWSNYPIPPNSISNFFVNTLV